MGRYKETHKVEIGKSDCFADKQVRNLNISLRDKLIEKTLLDAILKKSCQSQVVDTTFMVAVALKLGYSHISITRQFEEDLQTGEVKMTDLAPEYSIKQCEKWRDEEEDE